MENAMPGFRFSNFEKTPNWELALAVKNNNVREIEKQIKDYNVSIDFQDPKYHMTLLALAIVNDKKDAFDCLLKHRANPNLVIGNYYDITPFMCSIEYNQKCNNYYFETLLKNGGKPNFEIEYNHNGRIRKSSPLLLAIKANDEVGNFCVEMVKELCEKGADMDTYEYDKMTDFQEGVIYYCLFHKNMLALRYFIIEKGITIPEYVYTTGGAGQSTIRYYTLEEMLKKDSFKFNLYRANEKAKQDVLDYLEKEK
ncbi:hypothetical protein Y10_22120 [Neptunitalea sp. Y10]|uniref:Ankyrin repeat domain-containing protein n=2 Tax=Neptunitalea lumnitzerae TaxID=2965509 RepID=A0ABQ5MKC1_9FLAO|nr:hypothetical protein Y10_22120 [Neptunitalea sp. Y10]